MLEIKLRQIGNCVILDLGGRIDVDAANLVEVVGQCVRDGYLNILCNLEGIQVVDYMGISVIAIAYKEATNHNGRMKFANIPVHLRDMFTISGMDRVMEIYVCEDLAIQSFKEDKAIEDIKKMQLRRRFKRLPVDLKIELKFKRDNSPTCLKVEMLNLSAIGAFIFGCSNFKLGDDVILKMKLAPDPEVLELDARVVWVPDKGIQPHEYPGIGVEFFDITSKHQQKLIEFIERNLSSISSD
ncbi:MAG: PilZ domain-containing protein [Candidatus Omnitrophica bacterium]|nr:PilZ domain-containing protein [Candidatus Omnitrophota bacterium]